MKRTQKEIRDIVNEIGKLVGIGVNDNDIIQKLGLRRATYYIYKKRLFDEHAEVFKKLSATDLAFHISLYREKMARHASFLEAFLNNAVQSEEAEKIKQIAAVSAEYQNVRMNLLKLESESLAVITHERQKATDGYRRSPESHENGHLHEGSRNIYVLPPATTTDNLSQRKF